MIIVPIVCRRCGLHRCKFATGVVDTGGKPGSKFAAGIVDTGGKFATGIKTLAKLVEKFAASVVDTGGAP